MNEFIIGIDEVGRGSIAGPVTVVAFAMPKKSKILSPKPNLKLRDSKRLSPAQRMNWFKYLKSKPDFFYSISHVRPGIIDKINISNASNLAATRALIKLASKINSTNRNNLEIYLDGSLYITDSHINKKYRPKTIIKGDEKIKVISLASIIAKVSRDKLMTRLSKKYPKYGFEVHKGYGTKFHITAVKKYGPSQSHRLTFIQT